MKKVLEKSGFHRSLKIYVNILVWACCQQESYETVYFIFYITLFINRLHMYAR